MVDFTGLVGVLGCLVCAESARFSMLPFGLCQWNRIVSVWHGDCSNKGERGHFSHFENGIEATRHDHDPQKPPPLTDGRGHGAE